MSIKQMIYQFKLQANRVDSNQAQKLSMPAIILFINNGQLQLMKRRYGGNNNYRATLESIQKRIDEWQRVIIPHYEIEGIADEENKLYRFKLPFDKKYMFLLRASFLMSKGKCLNQSSVVNTQVQTDDLNINLDNPNTSSTFEWREINYRLAQDQILAYTDHSFSFSINTANIDYLRYPVDMDIEGYEHFDGTLSSDVDCELPAFLHPEIVNEAVLLFKASLNHPDLPAAQVVKAIEE